MTPDELSRIQKVFALFIRAGSGEASAAFEKLIESGIQLEDVAEPMSEGVWRTRYGDIEFRWFGDSCHAQGCDDDFVTESRSRMTPDERRRERESQDWLEELRKKERAETERDAQRKKDEERRAKEPTKWNWKSYAQAQARAWWLYRHGFDSGHPAWPTGLDGTLVSLDSDYSDLPCSEFEHYHEQT